MNRYKQIAYEQRYQIYFMLKMGISQTEIAKDIGVHRSTISRELRRNRGRRGYRTIQANKIASVDTLKPDVASNPKSGIVLNK